jgi:hypothetical protein
MTPDPLTVTPETRIISAQETMQCGPSPGRPTT